MKKLLELLLAKNLC